MTSQMPWLAGLEENKKGIMDSAYAPNFLEHMATTPMNIKTPNFSLTGIICTMGPASTNVDMIHSLIDAGMRICRLNFSHGTHESHAETINTIREAVSEYSRKIGRIFPLAIALDTKGPEIRTGNCAGGEEFELQAGGSVTLTIDGSKVDNCNSSEIYIDYENIVNLVKSGDKIYIDDGLIALTVTDVTSNSINCSIDNGGKVGSKKGCNFPGVPIDLPTLSEKDKGDIQFGIEQDVDLIFASFVRSGEAVKEIRQCLGEKGKAILVIPKIENHQGIENIDEIIEESDGIMIARGDLGIEVPPEKVLSVQKCLMGKCNKKGKPIICATQMLESMHDRPRPSRAEITDVGNAVLDGADCTMLSGETATGLFPVEAVTTMATIAKEAECLRYHKQLFDDLSSKVNPPIDPASAVAMAAVLTSLKCCAAAIIVITTSGRSAKLISQYRPRCPVIAVTRFSQVARQLQLWSAVDPVQYISPPLPDWQKDVDARIQFGITCGKKQRYIKAGDALIIVSGWRQGAGFTNTLRVLYASQQDCV